MKNLLKIVLVSSLAFLCFSCYYDEVLEIEEPPIVIDPDDPLSFSNDIVPIFESYNCSQCHNASLDPDLRAGNEYNSLVPDFVSAGNASASLFYTKLAIEGHRDVDAVSLALIEEWINRGALDN